MPQSFRPYPEPGSDTRGTFRLWPFLRDTILQGPFQFVGLVPHIVLPIYIGYLFIKRAGLWTETLQYTVDSLLIPLLQGLSVGGTLTMLFVRFGTAKGRLISTKRKERTATTSEDRQQHYVEVALWAYIYLGFGTILWQNFPRTDGPGMQAVHRVVSRIKVGLDLGDGWRSSGGKSSIGLDLGL